MKASKKLRARRDSRRAAYDALSVGAQRGRKRPGSLRKKGKVLAGGSK